MGSMMGPLQKRCSRCGEVRPLGWFVRKGAGRLRSECRECGRADRVVGAARRRSRLAVGGERVTQGDLDRMAQAQGWRCVLCRASIRFGYHVDHKRSLARGGTHTLANLQLLCAPCNLRKGAR